MRALFAIAILVAAPASAEVIRYHPGGHGWETSKLRKGPLRIEGPCLSACAWQAWANPQMCYGPKAEFYFHTPRDEGTGRVLWGAVAFYARQTPAWSYPELTVTAKELAELEPKRRCK